MFQIYLLPEALRLIKSEKGSHQERQQEGGD